MTPPKPVMKNATVIVCDDPVLDGQVMIAISRDGAFALAGPRDSARFIPLEELKMLLMNGPIAGDEMKAVALAAIEEAQRQES